MIAIIAALVLAAVADLASTRYALRRGALEANPFMRDQTVAIVLKAAVVVLVALGCAALRSDGQDGLAMLACAIVSLAWFAMAAHNVRVARRLRS